MKKKIYFSYLIILALYISSNSFSQVQQQWVAKYNTNTSTSDAANTIAVDDSGNVYVAGNSQNQQSTSMTTIKYNNNGVQQWVAKYQGIGGNENHIRSLKIDNKGYVYVTGEACVSSSSYTDVVTIKYNSAGTQVWNRSFHFPNFIDVWGRDLVLDNQSNVYVLAVRFDTNYVGDFVTMKYTYAGILQWHSEYNGPAGLHDYANRLSIDTANNLYSEGISWLNFLTYEFTIVKYNNLGVQQWVVRQFGGDNSSQERSGLYVDKQGNSYLAATSGYAGEFSLLVSKYNPQGNNLWIREYYSGINSAYECNWIVGDSLGYTYVTGRGYSGVEPELDGIITAKLSPAGEIKWIKGYGGPYITGDGEQVTIDRDRNVYVTGYLNLNSQNNQDYVTIKYDTAGNQKWIRTYNGTGSADDEAMGLFIDNFKNVYVTGYSRNSANNLEFCTIKYAQPIGINKISEMIPDKFSLSQNYPNPFNPATVINYRLPITNFVKLVIYDAPGREVAVLVNEKQQAGEYQVEWNASNYASGIYFYKLSTAEFTETKKMVLVK